MSFFFNIDVGNVKFLFGGDSFQYFDVIYIRIIQGDFLFNSKITFLQISKVYTRRGGIMFVLVRLRSFRPWVFLGFDGTVLFWYREKIWMIGFLLSRHTSAKPFAQSWEGKMRES